MNDIHWLIPALPVFWVVTTALLWGFTWLVYLAGMAVTAADHKLTGTSRKLAGAVGHLAGWTSTALNWWSFTVILLELPSERFLSTRLARHVRAGAGWRYRIAYKLGKTWLDPFDPSGTHIGATHHA